MKKVKQISEGVTGNIWMRSIVAEEWHCRQKSAQSDSENPEKAGNPCIHKGANFTSTVKGRANIFTHLHRKRS